MFSLMCLIFQFRRVHDMPSHSVDILINSEEMI